MTKTSQGKQTNKARNRRNNKAIMQPMLSLCAMNFASALTDPFGTPSGVCLPSTFPMPSVKHKSVIRTIMAVGLQGYGYVTLMPNGANNSDAVSVTTATTALSNTGPLSGATNVNGGAYITLPYTASQINSVQVQWRAVTCGIRIRYIGRSDAKNGIITCYEMPNHASVMSQSVQEIGSELNAKRLFPSGSGKWASVFSSGPKHPNDLDFQVNHNFENPYLVICVSGTAGDRYEVETVQHIEYIGASVDNLTSSESDPVGYSKVVNAIQKTASVQPLSYENGPSVFKQIVGVLSESLRLYNSFSPFLVDNTYDYIHAAITG